MEQVIVDWRNICKISTYSILSGAIACNFPTELEEIAMRIARRLYCIRAEFPNAEIILANDCAPYWRTAYINKWYNDAGLEPVAYKGNRKTRDWPFENSQEVIDELYDTVQAQLAEALELITIKEQGLEADDIWGILVKTGINDVSISEIIGVTTDSDWAQLCGDKVRIENPVTGTTITETLDITPKLIAGDRGDNIMGCMKLKKDGTPGTMWGEAGAKKLIEKKGEDWYKGLDANVLERNYNVIALPCPEWDMDQAIEDLLEVAIPARKVTPSYKNSILDKLGVTEKIRKELDIKEARQKWIADMREKFNAKAV